MCCEYILQYDFSKQINSDVQTGQGAAHITLIGLYADVFSALFRTAFIFGISEN